jgi:hypothetical protein
MSLSTHKEHQLERLLRHNRHLRRDRALHNLCIGDGLQRTQRSYNSHLRDLPHILEHQGALTDMQYI